MTLTKLVRRATLLAAAALLVTAVGIKPAPVHAMGTDSPPPADDGKKKKKESKGIEEQEQKLTQEKFLREYRAARQEILSGDYKAGIAALHALSQDDHPDVANYIGYANRKLGNYDQSKVWYEKALAADPQHVRTWSYYGMWHAEQGNRLKAVDYLARVNALCGNTTCEEFVQLKAVIDGTRSY